MFTPSSDPFDFAAQQARMSSAAATAFIAVIFLGVGFGALRFGMIRPVTSYVATEASPAIERAAEAAGLGFKEGYGTSPLSQSEIVKVKCRYCGHLNDEDAEYCSKCGKPL